MIKKIFLSFKTNFSKLNSKIGKINIEFKKKGCLAIAKNEKREKEYNSAPITTLLS